MTQPPYDHTLTDHIQLSGELICLKKSKDERVAWVVFLLQEMESMMPKQTFADLLESLQERITAKQAIGKW